MNAFRNLCVGVALAAIVLSGCGVPPGQPGKGSEVLAPSEVLDFSPLYADNCAGCHGADGRGGAAIALSDPVYLSLADDATIRNAIAKGRPGTAMPAFAQTSGGMLADKQIEVITSGMRSRWARSGILDGANPPSYAAKSAGNIAHGELAYKTYCESCHGPNGHGSTKASSITDGSFLALVSDQGLRTLVITGRPELGAPDWRGDVADKPMSDQDVTDVVAWLVSRRVQNPGQPYSVSNYAPH